MPFLGNFSDLFGPEPEPDADGDGRSSRRRSSNKMLEEGKRLSWTEIHDERIKKKKEVFSMHKYLAGEYEDNAEYNDGSDFDPHSADPKEWQLSETDDEDGETDDRNAFYKCIADGIERGNKVIEDYFMNPEGESKVDDPEIVNYNPEDPTTHPNYYKDPSFHPPDYWLLPYLQMSHHAHKLIICEEFKLFIIAVIILAGINVGIQLYEVEPEVFDVLDDIILGVFIFEVVAKVLSEGLRPLRYFHDSWNVFDFTIVVLSLPFMKAIIGGNAQVLRLVRLARMGKLVEKIPPLARIARGIAKGMASIGYILLLMFIVFYLYAIAGYYSFGVSDPFHFGEIMHNMLILYRVATLANWSDMLYINTFGCDVYANIYVQPEEFTPRNEYKWCEFPEKKPLVAGIYFFTFIIASSFVLMSLFVGTITTNMNSAMEEMKQRDKKKKVEKTKGKKMVKIMRLKSMYGMSKSMSFSPADVGGSCNESVDETWEGTSEKLKNCLGKVVLVTHKASDACAAMVEAIQAENYSCYVSSSAAETVLIIKDEEFDIVFVDISIEDSFKVPQQIRHYEMVNKAKFVQRKLHKIVHLITESTSEEIKHQLHTAGTNTFIEGPLDREKFKDYHDNPNEYKQDPSLMLSQSELEGTIEEDEEADIEEEVVKFKHWLIDLLPKKQAEELHRFHESRQEMKTQKEVDKFAHLLAIGYDLEDEHLAMQEEKKKK